MRTHISDHPAHKLAARIIAYLKNQKHAHIALSGGSTPKELYDLLADDMAGALDDWKVTVWQVDERCVPPSDERSNWRMIKATLLDKLPGLGAHRMEAEREDGADRYENLLRQQVPSGETGLPAFDIVLLGLGRDGHTASLFPDSPALDETERLVVRNEAPGIDPPRMTLTFPMLEAAAHRWFLVTGKEKADAVTALEDRDLPASRVADQSEFFLDPGAAGKA
jgi:6-phosphogluconolactonase